MKKLAFGLFLFIGLICRSDAQLNGEYDYDIADIFGKSIYCNEDGSDPAFGIVLNGYVTLGTTSSHNPKTGAFRVTGNTDFGEGDTLKLQPKDFNPSLPDTDYFALTSSPTIVSGKTYNNKQTGRAVFDISSGSIGLVGQYDVGVDTEVLVGIKKGSLGFRGKNLDLETAFGDGVDLIVNGSAVLNNRTTKRFNNTLPFYFGSWGNEPFIGEYVGSERYSQYSSFYLNLDVTTSGSNVAGSAEVFYAFATSGLDSGYLDVIYHPDLSDQNKWWLYSVKGTSKNGIATLNLTGLGVIKGLKATIYIDENTEEIIPNGKNSITLYGQTIKY
jgi:hypothetical protein